MKKAKGESRIKIPLGERNIRSTSSQGTIKRNQGLDSRRGTFRVDKEPSLGTV